MIYTDIHASGGEPAASIASRPPVPMKRGGEAEEVARAILWLLSDEASYLDRRVHRGQRRKVTVGNLVSW